MGLHSYLLFGNAGDIQAVSATKSALMIGHTFSAHFRFMIARSSAPSGSSNLPAATKIWVGDRLTISFAERPSRMPPISTVDGG
jgi:hypothetical protein